MNGEAKTNANAEFILYMCEHWIYYTLVAGYLNSWINFKSTIKESASKSVMTDDSNNNNNSA